MLLQYKQHAANFKVACRHNLQSQHENTKTFRSFKHESTFQHKKPFTQTVTLAACKEKSIPLTEKSISSISHAVGNGLCFRNIRLHNS